MYLGSSLIEELTEILALEILDGVSIEDLAGVRCAPLCATLAGCEAVVGEGQVGRES